MSLFKVTFESDNPAAIQVFKSVVREMKTRLSSGRPARWAKTEDFPAHWKRRAVSFAKKGKPFLFADLTDGAKPQQATMQAFIDWAEGHGGFVAEKKHPNKGGVGRPPWCFSAKPGGALDVPKVKRGRKAAS